MPGDSPYASLITWKLCWGNLLYAFTNLFLRVMPAMPVHSHSFESYAGRTCTLLQIFFWELSRMTCTFSPNSLSKVMPGNPLYAFANFFSRFMPALTVRSHHISFQKLCRMSLYASTKIYSRVKPAMPIRSHYNPFRKLCRYIPVCFQPNSFES